MNKTCSHGKTWDEDCADCEAVSATQELRSLIRDAEHAAKFFEEKPGMVSDPRVIPDLYRTIMRLAKAIATPPPNEKLTGGPSGPSS